MKKRTLKNTMLGLGLSALLLTTNASAGSKDESSKKEFLEYAGSETTCNYEIIRKKDSKKEEYLEVSLHPYEIFGERLSILDYYPPTPIVLDYYPTLSSAFGAKPPILIFPMSGGKEEMVEGNIARKYREAGFPTIIVNTDQYWDYFEDKLGDKFKAHIDSSFGFKITLDDISYPLNDLIEQELFAIHKTIDWVNERPELQGDNIGILGISRGGILASNYMGIDQGEKIKAAVFIISGAPYSEVVATSQEPGVKEIREKLLWASREKKENLEKELEKTITWDPLYGAENIKNPENVLIYIAKKDTFVPEKTGTKLAEAFGTSNVRYLRRTPLNFIVKMLSPFLPEKIREYTDPHIATTIPKRGKIKRETLRFFNEKLLD